MDAFTPARLPESEEDKVCVGQGVRPAALLPGSFNPVHAGHWGLAVAAQRHLQVPVAFELSLQNVDKPNLTADEVQRRVEQFAGKADLWLTRAPTFVQKARLFPGTVFVVGADTAARIVDARYYTDWDAWRRAADSFNDARCRFLVAARADASGQLLTLEGIAMPAAWRSLCLALDPGDFRLDVSSTALRAKVS
jgi:hypothetical protein